MAGEFKTTWRRAATISILVLIACGLIGWDIYVAIAESATPNASHSGSTISEVTLGFARNHPVLPFAIGVLCGHLLWPQRPRD